MICEWCGRLFISKGNFNLFCSKKCEKRRDKDIAERMKAKP